MTKPPDESSPKGSWSRTWDGLVSPELSQALFEASTLRKLVDGEMLYRRGDQSRELFGVSSGRLRLSITTADGSESLVGLYGPGTWFGEVTCFDERPRPTDVHAVGQTEVRVVPADKLRAILDRNPIWYRDFARVLCNKLRLALAHIETTILPISVRVGLRVLDLAEAYRFGDANSPIEITLSQEELARMLGVTRQSVNKELREFERRGWVKLGRGKLVLLEGAALREHVERGGASELLAQ